MSIPHTEAIDSISLLRGLILMWRKQLEIEIMECCSRFIKVQIIDNSINMIWSCLFIYGEPNTNRRVAFYKMIITKIKSTGNPLICIWD